VATAAAEQSRAEAGRQKAAGSRGKPGQRQSRGRLAAGARPPRGELGGAPVRLLGQCGAEGNGPQPNKQQPKRRKPQTATNAHDN
jgi:hypothetical protein